jgi:hypothetical protein
MTRARRWTAVEVMVLVALLVACGDDGDEETRTLANAVEVVVVHDAERNTDGSPIEVWALPTSTGMTNGYTT